MSFLPDFDALSEEQDDILDLPLDSSSIITGAPGTGKTVMALYRARMLDVAGRPTLLLMYGKLLSTYTKAAIKTLDIDGVVSTYHSWFPRYWRNVYGDAPPKIDRWTFDWDECKNRLMQSPPKPEDKLNVLIDEGQDMPKEFYLLMKLISTTITVFADENQRITENQSTLHEIKAATGVKEVLTLTRNYRNTRPIAELAAHFFTGASSGIPELPAKRRGEARPVLANHGRLFDAIDVIRNYETAHADQTIGVLLPYRNQVQKFYNRLKDKTRNPVQVYLSRGDQDGESNLPSIDFHKPGIKLVTHASAKGLEFDTVLLPELQSLKLDMGAEETRMRFYVLTSRAKQRLDLMYTGEGVPQLVDDLPHEYLETLHS